MTTTKNYFEFHEKYRKSYGDQVLVLFQIGEFYEMFNYDEESDPNIVEVEEDADDEENAEEPLNTLTGNQLRNGSGNGRIVAKLIGLKCYQVKPEKCLGITYLYKAGFPLPQLDKFVRRILAVNFIIIIVNQVKGINNRGKEVVIDRIVNSIVTPATSLVYASSGKNEEIPEMRRRNLNSYIIYLYIEPNERRERELADLFFPPSDFPGKIQENLSENSQEKLLKELPVVIGIAAIDVFTGHNIVYQIHSKENNRLFALHELYRFVHAHWPKELLIHIEGMEIPSSASPSSGGDIPSSSIKIETLKPLGTITLPSIFFSSLTTSLNEKIVEGDFVDKAGKALPRKNMRDLYRRFILQFLNLTENQNDIIIHPLQKIPKEYANLSYQEQTLRNLFPKSNGAKIDHITHHLGISRYPEGTLAYLALLNYCHQHGDIILQKLKPPQIRWNTDHLILTHNAIEQLNLFSSENERSGSKDTKDMKNAKAWTSLYEVINHTHTLMGARYLQQRLFNPSTKVSELEMSYSRIQILMNDQNLYENLGKILKALPDMDKLHTRLLKGLIFPSELVRLYSAYLLIPDILGKLLPYPEFSSLFLSTEMATHFNECLTIYNTYLLPDKIRSLKKDFSKLETEFLAPGLDAQVDAIREQITINRNYLISVANYFSTLLTGRSKPVELGTIKQKKDKKRGPNSTQEIYCLSTTKASGDRIVRIIRERGSNEFGNLSLEYYGTHCQIRSPILDTALGRLVEYQRINQELFAKWYNQILLWLQERGSFLDSLVLLIATLDFSHSGATSAKLYRYCRPSIQINNNISLKNDKTAKESPGETPREIPEISGKSSEATASLSLTEMRHPLKERIDNTAYITNDITIDESCRGAMIEGVNASGKTLLIKTVVNLVIMAQMGLFVPAKQMIYYPYDIIVTRLKGDDDMFRGKSSFDVEVEELDTCLRNKGRRTLVVADELCKGTETHSALSLAAATILELLESQTSFLFATHLHDLSNGDLFPEITAHRELQFFHLSSFHDKEKNIMIYEYKLRPGPSISIYGLEVARSKGLDKNFLDRAEMFRKRLAGEGSHLLSLNRSRYNSKVFKDKCNFCGSIKDLHDHHIVPQNQADSDGFLNHFHKNAAFNQIILCQKCHHDIHSGKLLFSRIQTNDGQIDNFEVK